MTQQELINTLTGTETLDLEITITDNAETKVTARFLSLAFEINSIVAMKLEITTINKNVSITQSGETKPLPPVKYIKIIRADSTTQIPVVDETNTPVIADNGEPLTIPENVYWKYLAWEQPLALGFKNLLTSVIMVKFDLIPNQLVLQLDRADYPEL